MKRNLIDILACPVCQSSLEMSVEDETEKEIIKGSLYCPGCDVYYPINEGIPNLLPQNKVSQA
jgi:uncharacterized protein YbaR (Trm112 family)